MTDYLAYTFNRQDSNGVPDYLTCTITVSVQTGLRIQLYHPGHVGGDFAIQYLRVL